MDGNWVVVIVSYRDGEAFSGNRVASLRVNNKSTAEDVAAFCRKTADGYVEIFHDPA